MLLGCPGCDGPIVAYVDVFYTDIVEYRYIRRVFPQPPPALASPVPKAIRLAFDEMQLCLDGQAYTAATVMGRRCVEAITDELDQEGSSRRTLEAKIEDLAESGMISPELAMWATALRHLGNEAAHNSGSMASAADAEDVAAFTQALAEYCFVVRRRYDEFRHRRAAATKGTPVEASPAAD